MNDFVLIGGAVYFIAAHALLIISFILEWI